VRGTITPHIQDFEFASFSLKSMLVRIHFIDKSYYTLHVCESCHIYRLLVRTCKRRGIENYATFQFCLQAPKHCMLEGNELMKDVAHKAGMQTFEPNDTNKPMMHLLLHRHIHGEDPQGSEATACCVEEVRLVDFTAIACVVIPTVLF